MQLKLEKMELFSSVSFDCVHLTSLYAQTIKCVGRQMLTLPPEAQTQINTLCCRYHAAPTQYVMLQMSIHTLPQHHATAHLGGQHMAGKNLFYAPQRALNTSN